MAKKKTTPKKEILKVGDTVFYKGNKNYLAMILMSIDTIINEKMGRCWWVDVISNARLEAVYPLNMLTKKAPLEPLLGFSKG